MFLYPFFKMKVLNQFDRIFLNNLIIIKRKERKTHIEKMNWRNH